jgi:hypothetical protein
VLFRCDVSSWCVFTQVAMETHSKRNSKHEFVSRVDHKNPATVYVTFHSFLFSSLHAGERPATRPRLLYHQGKTRSRLRLKCDGTHADTRFRLSAKRTSPFKLVGAVSSVDYWQPRCVHQWVVMLVTPRSGVVWRVLDTHSIRLFPLHFPSRASLRVITFQLDSTYQMTIFITGLQEPGLGCGPDLTGSQCVR